VEKEIRALQSLAARQDGWTPPIVKTVATDGRGIPELLEAISGYESYLRAHNQLQARRIHNWEARLLEMLRDTLLEKARAALSYGDLERYAAEIAEHKRDPYSVIEEIAGNLSRD